MNMPNNYVISIHTCVHFTVQLYYTCSAQWWQCVQINVHIHIILITPTPVTLRNWGSIVAVPTGMHCLNGCETLAIHKHRFVPGQSPNDPIGPIKHQRNLLHQTSVGTVPTVGRPPTKCGCCFLIGRGGGVSPEQYLHKSSCGM